MPAGPGASYETKLSPYQRVSVFCPDGDIHLGWSIELRPIDTRKAVDLSTLPTVVYVDVMKILGWTLSEAWTTSGAENYKVEWSTPSGGKQTTYAERDGRTRLDVTEYGVYRGDVYCYNGVMDGSSNPVYPDTPSGYVTFNAKEPL